MWTNLPDDVHRASRGETLLVCLFVLTTAAYLWSASLWWANQRRRS